MRPILATILLAVMMAGNQPAPTVWAGVVIDMPAPRKPARVNVAATAADAAVMAAPVETDVGDLALARYGGAREGTSDNYFVMPYRNYSYPWPYGWGVYGWPWWGFGGWSCVSACPTSGRVCR